MISFFLLILTAIFECLFVFSNSLRGNVGIMVGIVANLVMIPIVGSRLIDVFGYTTNAGNIFYAAVFLGFQQLLERNEESPIIYVFISLISVSFIAMMTYLTMQVPVSVYNTQAEPVFVNSENRIALASAIAYLLSATTMIWVYRYLQVKRASLWLRAVGTQIAAQALDSIVFFTIAFVGIVTYSTVLEITLAGYLIKVIFSVISLPVLYLRRK